MAGSGEYEPRDSRNVTGTASTPDGRWTNKGAKPPNAAGVIEEVELEAADEADQDDEDALDDETIFFEPDPELAERIAQAGQQTRH